jgi:hypothetical protein
VRRALINVLIFVVLLAAIIAFSIWFNLGPAVHSAAG